MDNPLTLQEAKDQITGWVNGADRYNQNLQSHLDYATNEIMKILELYARSKYNESARAVLMSMNGWVDEGDIPEFKP